MFFSDADKHPGFISLTTVIGTILFIINTNENQLAYKFFTWKPVVFTGVISYSLYLYHQPVFVYYRFQYGELNNKVFFILILITFFLAYSSYRFFEDPMRRSKSKFKYLVMLGLVAIIFTFVNGAVNTKGYPKRQLDDIRNALVNFETVEYVRAIQKTSGVDWEGKPSEKCINRTPDTACITGESTDNLILVGDSYAGVFAYSLTQYAEQGEFKLINYSNSSCPLLTSPIWFGKNHFCYEANKQRWDKIEKLPPSTILIGTNFNQFYNGKKSKANYKRGEVNLDVRVDSEFVWADFAKAINRLVQLGHTPIIITQPPQPIVDVKLESVKKMQQGILHFEQEYEANINKKVESDFKEYVSAIAGAKYIDLANKLCSDKGCLTMSKSGGVYNDGAHLSYYGVQIFIDDIISLVKIIFSQKDDDH